MEHELQEEQVGHLPRVIVTALAPLLDSGMLFLEGVIPRGSKNVFKIPCKLLCFAKEGQEDVVLGRLRAERLYVSGDYDAESLFEVRLWTRSHGRHVPVFLVHAIYSVQHHACLQCESAGCWHVQMHHGPVHVRHLTSDNSNAVSAFHFPILSSCNPHAAYQQPSRAAVMKEQIIGTMRQTGADARQACQQNSGSAADRLSSM